MAVDQYIDRGLDLMLNSVITSKGVRLLKRMNEAANEVAAVLSAPK
jgi:hypothetical protein